MLIRDARLSDLPAIRRVVTAAFAQADEAALVDRLRSEGDALIELVALQAGDVIGHILFSALPILRADASLNAAALAPVSVAPAHQNQGVGERLIRAGLEKCRAFGLKAVIVMGHPSYYPRFGFSAESAESLDAPFSGPAFMALELEPGALKAGGKVRYAAAFGV
ncbi:MAG: GNAT family N-acetyltransferase [Hyphomonadaceae bacterium]